MKLAALFITISIECVGRAPYFNSEGPDAEWILSDPLIGRLFGKGHIGKFEGSI